ncbi:MAG: DUF547 domain-containing protein [Alphaproteobacteria bacterium]|nr:DUF547 domain-containing protein [Alphaproteobacteria bacterium]
MIPRLVAFLLLWPLASWAAPEAKLWPRWLAHDPAATRAIDHAPWSAFLARYLVRGADGINRLAYGRVSMEDRAALDAYVTTLEASPVSQLARPEQKAFWINLYNALTVRTVLAHYPVASIKDIRISPGLFASGPWGRKLATVEGEALSLDDIEHRILRPIFADPRLHYALNCAALGCPNLGATAYGVADLEDRLDAAARDFINHPRGVRLVRGKLHVSSIFVWFGVDFGRDEAALSAHFRAHAAPALAEALKGVGAIADHDYDWRLNDAGGN